MSMIAEYAARLDEAARTAAFRPPPWLVVWVEVNAKSA